MKNNITRLIKSAVFAALACVCTMVIAIPLGGGGYANLGDTVVIASGFFGGPFFGAFAAAIGSALADVLSGYVVYAPATFVIKGCMALVVGAICKNVNKNGFTWHLIPAAILAEAIMVLGYFLYEIVIYGLGVAIVDIPGNAVQGACGILFSMILVNVLNANKNVRKLIKI